MAISGIVLPLNWEITLCRCSIPNSTLSTEDSPHLAYLLTTLFLKMTQSFDNSVPENDSILRQLCSWKWPDPLTTLFLKMTLSFDNSVPENGPILWQLCSWKWPDPLTTLFLKMTRSFDNSFLENDPILWQLRSWKWPDPSTTLFLKMTRSFDNSVPENGPILWQSCSPGGLHRGDQGHLLGPRRGEHLHWAAGGAVQGPWVQRGILDRYDHKVLTYVEYRARTFKCLWGPGIDAEEWIPPAYVVWRAGTKTLFLLGA